MSTHLTRSMHLASLWCAAQLVPASKRQDWLQEWTSELWYVREACISNREISWQGEQEVTAFCLGAFQDAFCLRRSQPRHKLSKIHPLHSAAQCAFFLSFLVATTWCLTFVLPGVRTTIQPPPYRDSHNLIIISTEGSAEGGRPSIRASQYRFWRDQSQHLFNDFAFYQTSIKSLHIGPHKTPELNIARSSANLFTLTGLPLLFADSKEPVRGSLPSLVLTEKLWRTAFNADPHITGRIFKVGLRSVKVAGVLPDGSWQLPGKIDAWLLEPDNRVASIPSITCGYVLARRDSSLLQTPATGIWRLFSAGPDGAPLSFDCISFNDAKQNPFGIFTFTLFLAILSLPATTSLPLGDYPASRHNLRWSIKLRRWIFLCAKFVSVLPIVYFGSLDLAYCNARLLRKHRNTFRASFLSPLYSSLFAGLFAISESVVQSVCAC